MIILKEKHLEMNKHLLNKILNHTNKSMIHIELKEMLV
jgi:hypothetical protein